MFKTCVLLGDSLGLNIGKVWQFHTQQVSKKFRVVKTQTFTQFFQTPVHQLLHIKSLLNLSVKQCFSTVSTQPIIKTTNLIFNILLIKSVRS